MIYFNYRIVLTSKQKETYDYIINHALHNNTYATYRDIGKKFNISEKTVFDRITALKLKGWIRKDKRQIVPNDLFIIYHDNNYKNSIKFKTLRSLIKRIKELRNGNNEKC